MKKLAFLSLCSCLLLAACRNEEKPKPEAPVVKEEIAYFGDTITDGGATPANQLLKELDGKDSLSVKVTATIEEVCQKKGCWMDVSLGNGKMMKVSFKDYAFFVPKDAAGKTAVFEGFAYIDTISMNQLRHYAEDEGKTKEEIAKITKPEVSVSFEARGVIIKK
ncbi:MAG: DUF4920 domain-containing protein [Bacteroidia bacterium]